MSNYTKMIAQTLGISQTEVSNVCVTVAVADGAYVCSFIQNETDDILSIVYIIPEEEGMEKFAFINKKYIIDIVPMDMAEVYDFTKPTEEEETTMFG